MDTSDKWFTLENRGGPDLGIAIVDGSILPPRSCSHPLREDADTAGGTIECARAISIYMLCLSYAWRSLIGLNVLMGLQQRLVEAFCCPSPLSVSTLICPGLVEVYD